MVEQVIPDAGKLVELALRFCGVRRNDHSTTYSFPATVVILPVWLAVNAAYWLGCALLVSVSSFGSFAYRLGRRAPSSDTAKSEGEV